MSIEKTINIIVVVLIIILIAGIGTLVVYQKHRYKDVYFKYNGYDVQKVVKNGIYYELTMGFAKENSPNENVIPVRISSRNDPRTLENISVQGDIKNPIYKKGLYVVFEKNATGPSVIAGMEISKITGNPSLYNINTTGAMIESIEGKSVPVKTCKDVSASTGVIWLRAGKETKIFNEKDCIIIEGTNEYELIRGADRYILTLLGIMKQ